MIRKTSTTANGGKAATVVTYEDLLKDPQVMESMKKSLGLFVDCFHNFFLPFYQNDLNPSSIYSCHIWEMNSAIWAVGH